MRRPAGAREPEQGQHADREGDVGGGGDRPAGEQIALPPVAPGVHQRRRQHAAERGDGRQQRAAAGRELAHQEFPLDLEPDQQEEHGHEAVVDPVQQVLGQLERRDTDGHVAQQRPGVVRTQRRVRDQHGQHHRTHERQRRRYVALTGVFVLVSPGRRSHAPAC
jgi:hypothetical protein